MSNVVIWVHVVWGTKNRYPFLKQPYRDQIIKHIKSNGWSKSLYLRSVNGHVDHLHCLAALGTEMNLSKLVMLIKGESSFWINKQNIFPMKFEWAHEYYARSVCESHVWMVDQYIKNQEAHHNKITWEDELADFLKMYDANSTLSSPDIFPPIP
jgi:putative transposase